MDLLRAAGADVNARITDVTSLTGRIARTNTMTDRQGQTALFSVAQAGRIPVVRYLLEHGADVHAVDDMGRTVIEVVEGSGGSRDDARVQEMVALLKGAGVAGN
jgi:ankyrin repeat protein